MSIAIQIENVSKQYRLGEVGTGTLSHDLHRAWAKMRGKPDPFAKVGEVNNREEAGGDYAWALKDISFKVQQGEILGIIGRNGAGKSTLLKLLSRITAPTTGKIRTRGRIASLLEVGTGFHPELTGRENVYLNGAIMGMTRPEITTRLDEIVEFSGCAKYIDTPVKRYSSGMTVRLGFAVAAHLNCEILIVDEVLAVGDAEFQKRCIGKMQEVSTNSGKSVLFVSHNLESIRQLTKRAVWMERGSIQDSGEPETILTRYSQVTCDTTEAGFPADPDKEIVIRNVSVCQDRNFTSLLEYSKPIHVQVKFDVNQQISGAHVAIILRRGGIPLVTSGDADLDTDRLTERKTGTYDFSVAIPEHLLSEGAYTISVTSGVPFVHAIDRHEDVVGFTIADDYSPIRKFIHRPHPGLIHLNLPWVES